MSFNLYEKFPLTTAVYDNDDREAEYSSVCAFRISDRYWIFPLIAERKILIFRYICAEHLIFGTHYKILA